MTEAEAVKVKEAIEKKIAELKVLVEDLQEATKPLGSIMP